MIDERHIEADEAHHVPYGVWSSMVERRVVAPVRAGSIPVTPPTRIRLRSYQLEALESFSQPARGHVVFAGRRYGRSLAVAQLVERRFETPRVTGSNPVRGTGLKHKI